MRDELPKADGPPAGALKGLSLGECLLRKWGGTVRTKLGGYRNMNRRGKQPGPVIIGGSFHSLGAARNLAKHGAPVCILDGGICVSQFSRYVGSFLKCPSADDDVGFVEFLLRISEERKMDGWVLFPSTDEFVRIVARHRERLSEHCLVTIPSWEVARLLYDKRLTHRLADEQEIPIPKTYNPRNVADLASLSLDFPVVLKPAISKHFMAATKKKAYRADNEKELISLHETTARVIDRSETLIPELIPDRAENLYSFVGFFIDGMPRLRAGQPGDHVNTRWNSVGPARMSSPWTFWN